MKKNKLFLMLLAFFAFGQMGWAQNIVSVNYVDENGTTQNVNATSLDHIASVNPDGAIIGSSGFTNWYVVQGNDVVINGQLGFYGGINLILCDGAKLTIDKTDGDAIASLDNTDTKYTLTIYVQAGGTGQLVANASSSAIHTENLTIHGGVITATGGTRGIYAPQNNIVINGGTVTAVAQNGNAIEGYNVTINGGIVSATGNGGIQNGMTGTTTLGYTNNTDRITATNYLLGQTATIKVKDGQYMITNNGVIIYGSLDEDKRNAIAGRILSPYIPTEWEGLGTAQSPYIIDSEEDLILLSLRTNGGSHHYRDTCFKLGANITFSASSDWNDASNTESNFTAIGSFSGHFDGDVYTISGLRIRKDDGVGLFSYLADGAVVENITLNNSRVTGNSKIGGIVGSLQSGTTVNNCHVTNTVYVYSKYHYTGIRGGVVGYNYGGTISNCVSEATIGRTTEVWDNTNDKAGGIVGVNESGTLTGNLVIGANITCQTENYGAIAGNNENGTLTNNYYHACTVNGTANAVNIGVNGADITTSNGAMSIHTITKPNDVTITTEPTLVYGGTNFWKHGTTITLSGGLGGTPTAGWQNAYFVNNVANTSDPFTPSNTFPITPARDIEITIGQIHADWATSGAQGTEQDPYLIYFTDQLDLLATRVNNGTSTYSGNYFKLMDNLTYSYNGLGSDESNYTPIGFGYENNMFMGHFDGNNKIVSGIRIRKTGTGTDACYLGLFGSTKEAEVKDVIIQNSEIIGHRYLGGVVGHSWSTMVSGCHVWNNVTIVLTQDDSNTAGGIAGHNDLYQSATITNCISEVRIITNTNSHCYNIGGIVGLNDDVVSNNFVMSAYIGGGSQVGAIVGAGRYNHALSNNYYRNCVVNNASTNVGYNGADVTDNDGAVGVYTITINAQDVILSSSNEPMVTYQGIDYWKSGQNITLEGGLNGTPAPGCQKAYFINGVALTESTLVVSNTFDMPAHDVTVTIGEIHADWETAGNAGTENDPYEIYFTDQLDLLATRVNDGTAYHAYADKYFKLMNDLTYSYEGLGATESNFTAIGGYNNHFSGHFNGNNKTISGIRIYKGGTAQAVDDYQGLFGYIDSWYPHGPGDVKNLTLNDAVITGRDCVGGIVGRLNAGTVDSCHVTSSVFIHSVASDDIYCHGGIVGQLINTPSVVSHCTSSATLTANQNATYIRYFGGIVGSCNNSTLTDNFAIGAIIPGATESYHNGAIAGSVSYGTVERNYYQGCKVESTNVTPSGVGCGGYNVDPYDIIENDGAVPVFTLSVASGITAEATVTLTHNEVDYYKLGTSVSLSYVTPAAPGYRHIYSVNGWPIEGNIFYMDDDAEVTVAPNQLIDFEEHQGSEDDPYLIYYKEQWDLLAERVNGTNAAPKTYSGKFFKLMEDISIATMVGANTTDKYFAGTFDGNGHKLTVSYNNTTDQHTAAFRNVIGATIKNLHVDGTIETSTYGPGGIVANNYGVTLINCRSSVSITSSRSDAAAGGLIAYTKGSVPTIIEGCVFDGTLTATGSANNFGGFMGWVNCNDGATVSITNSLYNPVSTNVTSGCMTFVRSNNDNLNNPNKINITNCYYTQTLGTAQGDKVYTITPAEPVTMQLLGDAEVYDVSGITIYGTGDKGLKFDDVFYAASGNVLDLNLGVTVPFTVANYLANGYVITFDNTGNNYTLTMPDEDVIITATFSDVAWDGEGTEESPYLIYYNVQWDLLGTNVNAGNNYNGVYFKLMDDISVETMVGSTDRPFRGIFDGGGHTLTFNKGSEASPYDQNFCAPFKAVEAATIKNLHTTGAIYTSKQHAAGFVAQLIPNTGNFTRFISCRSSMKINSTVASDARTGGFIGSCSDALPSFTEVVDRLSIYFEDCLFDGEFSGTATGWGGFIGYYFHCISESGNSGKVHFTRCLFAPSAMNISTTDAYNFVRSDLYGWSGEEGAWIHAHHSYPEDVMTITKLYYTITCGNLENYPDEVQPTPVGNMTNVQLRNALGDNWMIVTEEAVEKVVPTMGNVVTRVIAGYGDSEESDKWAFIASPVTTQGGIAPSVVGNLLGSEISAGVYDFDLYRFNQSANLEWENYYAHTSDFNLVNGQGYLYATKDTKTLVFKGPFNTEEAMSVGLIYETVNPNAAMHGWNLIGNPLTEPAYVDRPFYQMNNEGSDIEPVENYDSYSPTTIPMCTGIMVKAEAEGESVTFSTTAPNQKSAINNGSLQMTLSKANGRSNAFQDKAIVSFNEGTKLEKFIFNEKHAKLYIPQDGEDYAIANVDRDARPCVSTEIPVHFKATETGKYTITFNGDDMDGVKFVDKFENTVIDLDITDCYTFIGSVADSRDRFVLVFGDAGNASDNDIFAYQNGSDIIVTGEGTLEIYDVMGRKVSTQRMNGVETISAPAQGVYIFRLVGNGIKTQKIVVR